MSDLIQDARRATLALKYRGVNITETLNNCLIDFIYTDAAPGEQDTISLNLDDREGKWLGAWKPEFSDRIVAEIIVTNWDKPGDKAKLNCGSFEVESVDISGPDDVVSLNATALPVGSSGAKQEKRTKAWEKIKLSAIAQQIANTAKLKLVYSVKANPTYDRLDQTDVSDLAFLVETCKAEGIAVKASGSSLVLFDESVYEKVVPKIKIERGKSNIVSYSFSESSSSVAYGSCIVTYKPTITASKKKKVATKKKDDYKSILDQVAPMEITTKATTASTKKAGVEKAVTGSYVIPNFKGPVLRITEKTESVAEAQRLAKNRLREANKEAGLATIVLDGDVRMMSGVTVEIVGFGRFDGRYIIVSSPHSIGGAYTTTINIRKVLGW